MFLKLGMKKAMQRALLQFRNPKHYNLVHEALTEAGRTDLIGYGPKCLIRGLKGNKNNKEHNKTKSKYIINLKAKNKPSTKENNRKESKGRLKQSKPKDRG